MRIEQYLTYEDYKKLGGSLEEMPFKILEFETKSRIDGRTQNRFKDIDEIPKELKMCEYAIINSIQNSLSGNKGVNLASESIDGYSVSYLSPSEVQTAIVTKQKELEDIMRAYLLETKVDGVPVLYRGL